MVVPFYESAHVTLYLGNCLDTDVWDVSNGVLVTDPPYGIAFKSGWTNLALRDHVLERWGERPAIIFGSPSMPEPSAVKARLVWHRPGSGMGDLKMPWKPDWEIIYVIGRGFAAERRGSGVLRYTKGHKLHPHQKPVPLMQDLIGKCPPGVIVDPFVGSGSTLVAAVLEGRNAVGIELDEGYCKIAAERIERAEAMVKGLDAA